MNPTRRSDVKQTLVFIDRFWELRRGPGSARFRARDRRRTIRAEGTLIDNVRIALANIRVPTTPDDSVRLATSAVADAGRQGAVVICFPECFVPGYRWPGHKAPSPDPAFLERAWAAVAEAAQRERVAVILGTERITDRGLQISACVIDPDGAIAGWQDKTQITPRRKVPIRRSEPSVGCSAWGR